MPIPVVPLVDPYDATGAPDLARVAEGVQALARYLQRMRAALDGFTPSAVAAALDRGSLGVWPESPLAALPRPDATSAPDAPAGVVAVGAWRAILVTWTLDPHPRIVGWEVQRALDAAFTTGVTTLTAARALAFVDRDLPDGATRYYRVRALTPTGASPYSAIVSATTLTSPDGEGAALDEAVRLVQRAHIRSAVIDTARITDAAIVSAKIADAAVTTAKIADAAIDSAKIADAAITTAKIADAAITTAKVAELSADKLTAGTIQALVDVGVGQIELDGTTGLIRVRDNQVPPKVRVEIGKLGSGSTQYGFRAYSNTGAVMWDSLNQGATSAGIKDLAVVAAKIDALAVQTGKLSNTAVTTPKRQTLHLKTISKTVLNNGSAAFVISADELGTAGSVTWLIEGGPLNSAPRFAYLIENAGNLSVLVGNTTGAAFTITVAFYYW